MEIDEVSLNSVIGAGTSFRGEFSIKGILRIDGAFEGFINTEGSVLIGQRGRVSSDIFASSITVGGEVVGDLYARDIITLLSTAIVKGIIVAPRIIMEEGVVFNGRCMTLHGEKLSEVFERERGRRKIEVKMIMDEYFFYCL